MSLKAFHIAFIAIAIGITGAFAVWCFRSYASQADTATLVLGIVSALAAAGLIAYAVRVRRKLKDFGWL